MGVALGMCGIAGVVSFSGEPAVPSPILDAMAGVLAHRGPDASGSLRFEQEDFSVGLAHTRLSIIDLSSAANQPMRSASGRSAIVFNGEIYNYEALRRSLVEVGLPFRTRSDTEVLLNGYEAWGMAGLLERVDGMFAFGLVDLQEHVLYLARDPFGKKPCYYWQDSSRQRVAFSSDVRSFRPLGLPMDVDWGAVGYFFSELATPELQSIWRDAKKLPGGHFMCVSSRGCSLLRYWNLTYSSDCNLAWDDLVDSVGELLRAAVRKRLVGDVRCAALLSGGVDSSLVVMEMARASSRPVRTYTVGFEDSPFDERSFAKSVAERFGTDHTEMVVRARDVERARRLLPEYGEPFADMAAVPTYLIAKEVSATEKVVLTGDGGDELFAGYYEYYFAKKLNRLRHFAAAAPIASALARLWPSYRTRFLQRLLAAARQPVHRLFYRGFGFSPEQLMRLLPRGKDVPAVWRGLDQEHQRVWDCHCSQYTHTLTQVLAGNLYTRLATNHLVKVDRASMFASLEARSPLLDRDLARLAATLRPEQLLRMEQPKAILKALALRHLPASLVLQEKRGFGVPIADWLRGDLKTEFRDTVLGGRQQLLPMDYGYVEELLEAHQRGADYSHRLWALYAFHVWAQDVALASLGAR